MTETAEFPGWTPVWRTTTGRWWTTRRAELTRAQRDAGCAVTVSADSVEALQELVSLHDALAARAAELVAVPIRA